MGFKSRVKLWWSKLIFNIQSFKKKALNSTPVEVTFVVVKIVFLRCVIKWENKKTRARRAACFYCVMVPLVDLRCSKPELSVQALWWTEGTTFAAGLSRMDISLELRPPSLLPLKKHRVIECSLCNTHKRKMSGAHQSSNLGRDECVN